MGLVATVLGGVSKIEGNKPRENEFSYAFELGQLLSKHGFSIVSGAITDLDKAILMGATRSGAKTIAVSVRKKPGIEMAKYINATKLTKNLYEKYDELYSLATVIVGFSGGIDSLAAIAYSWNMNQKSSKYKPIFLYAPIWESIFNEAKGLRMTKENMKNTQFFSSTLEFGKALEQYKNGFSA